MKKLIPLILFAVLLFPSCRQSAKYSEKWIEETLSQMTIDEKVAMVHAQSKFSSPGVPRLGIPEIWCTDGPHGIRPEVLWDEWEQAGWTSDSCTAYPALTCLAATWDRDLARLYGESIGEEARYRGKDVLLAPGVNICRTPLGGRNFEYFGEDPYLAGRLAVDYIQGVQSKGVATCVKHYALNNTELNRHNVNIHIDDRALYEIYLPAFKAAVQEGKAWSVMGAYNLYKDQHACHNSILLNDILKEEWGFDGAVISDWGGVHDTDEAIKNGLDLEFGTWTDGLTMGKTNSYESYYLAAPYKELIAKGEVGTKELDEKVRRVLRLITRTAMADEYGHGRFTCPEHYAAARKIGAEGIVLLKNEGGLLPIKEDAKILVVGENAVKMMTVGGGSSSLKVQREISPLEGIRERFANVEYERGYVGDVTGFYNGVSSGQDLSDERSPEQLIADAAAKAAQADVVVFVGGLNKSKYQDCEGVDRIQYGLPYGQDELIEALVCANQNVVVVNISGSPVAMPWEGRVSAILQDWYLGSEAGRSLADVLSGDVNPSGKLPFTFPVNLEDGPVTTPEQYPGIGRENSRIIDLYYTEGIYVGYRWYDTKKVKPLFAFGHGLSYTEFEYSEAEYRNGKVSLSVKNVGDVAGAEVVQLYISDPECSVDRPEKELKGFEKIFLAAGESKRVEFVITEDALSYFDADAHKWVAEKGSFIAHVGSASDDIRTSVEFKY